MGSRSSSSAKTVMAEMAEMAEMAPAVEVGRSEGTRDTFND